MCLCVRWWLYKPILALNCRLQIEQVNSDCAESDDGPLVLAFLSLRFLSASQILFASNWEAPLCKLTNIHITNRTYAPRHEKMLM